jgi:hypothetical protein
MSHHESSLFYLSANHQKLPQQRSPKPLLKNPYMSTLIHCMMTSSDDVIILMSHPVQRGNESINVVLNLQRIHES